MLFSSTSIGSPPPMRGKEDQSLTACICHRITPAYAGKSSGLWNREWKRKDHPRLCGEKLPTYIEAYLLSGITPAYAGKSRVIGRSDDTKKDHPRLCGEKFVGEMLRKIVEGSPPPMRGKGPHRAAFQRSSRITPAYAGKSFKVSTGGLCS